MSENTIRNMFDALPTELPEELIEVLAKGVQLRIERVVSHGHTSALGFWYDQPQHEWVMVLRGAARLRFEHQTIELRPGDFLTIPAHQKHRVDWTTLDEPTIWLAVHYHSGT